MPISGGELEFRLERLEHAIFGSGDDGLIEDFRNFYVAWNATEEEKKRAFALRESDQVRREKKFNKTVAVIGIILTIISIGLVILGMWFQSLRDHHAVTNIAPPGMNASKPVQTAIEPSLR